MKVEFMPGIAAASFSRAPVQDESRSMADR